MNEYINKFIRKIDAPIMLRYELGDNGKLGFWICFSKEEQLSKIQGKIYLTFFYWKDGKCFQKGLSFFK